MIGIDGDHSQIPFDTFLPEECTLHIFTELGLKAILNATLVSSNWYRFANDNKVWDSLRKKFLMEASQQDLGFKGHPLESTIQAGWSRFLQATEELFPVGEDKKQSLKDLVLFVNAVKAFYMDSLKELEKKLGDQFKEVIANRTDLDTFSYMIMRAYHPDYEAGNCKPFWDRLSPDHKKMFRFILMNYFEKHKEYETTLIRYHVFCTIEDFQRPPQIDEDLELPEETEIV